MPQTLNYTFSAAFDKGPTINGGSKTDASSYTPCIEDVCQCDCAEIELNIAPADLNFIDMLIISSDKYVNDKDPCPPVAGQPPRCSNLKYRLEAPGAPMPASAADCAAAQPAATPAAPRTCKDQTYTDVLNRPIILVYPFLQRLYNAGLSKLYVRNDLSTSVKISVLVVRKAKTKC